MSFNSSDPWLVGSTINLQLSFTSSNIWNYSYIFQFNLWLYCFTFDSQNCYFLKLWNNLFGDPIKLSFLESGHTLNNICGCDIKFLCHYFYNKHYCSVDIKITLLPNEKCSSFSDTKYFVSTKVKVCIF